MNCQMYHRNDHLINFISHFIQRAVADRGIPLAENILSDASAAQ